MFSLVTLMAIMCNCSIVLHQYHFDKFGLDFHEQNQIHYCEDISATHTPIKSVQAHPVSSQISVAAPFSVPD